MDVVYFVVLVGVLIFVHELGHYAWAKLFGVKVIKFSLGFGPKIAGFKTSETEYCVSLIPLGGYVHMLGENPKDIVSEADKPRSFKEQSLFRKVIIVLAGPAMNLVFPLAIFLLVFLSNAGQPPPLVGSTLPGRPAESRLLAGDRILAVNGEEVETFYDVSRQVAAHPNEPLEFIVERNGETITETITPSLEREAKALEQVEEVGRVGITPHEPLAVIGVMSPDSPAHSSGLRTFDKIVSAGGRDIRVFRELRDRFRGNRGRSMPVTYLRPIRVDNALGGLLDMEVYTPHVATVTPEAGPGHALLRAGIESSDLYVSTVVRNSPEHRAGVLPGDRIVSLDHRPVTRWTAFLEDLKRDGQAEHTLAWRRGPILRTAQYRLKHEQGVTEHGEAYDRYVVGVGHWAPTVRPEPVEPSNAFLYAAQRAFDSTWEMGELTVYSVLRLLQGRITVKSLGGPLSIFEAAGDAARESTFDYLRLMAFISVNLGLINLLPIPVLDGGYLLFFFIEAVTRRKIPERARQYASIVGLVILMGLMGLALKNDIERAFPDLFKEDAAQTSGSRDRAPPGEVPSQEPSAAQPEVPSNDDQVAE